VNAAFLAVVRFDGKFLEWLAGVSNVKNVDRLLISASKNKIRRRTMPATRTDAVFTLEAMDRW
jgi:hypothetical protein